MIEYRDGKWYKNNEEISEERVKAEVPAYYRQKIREEKNEIRTS